MLSLMAGATCVMVVAGATPMKLKSVTLYKNGLGYYERESKASPNQELEIPLGPGQLSDAVKSLVVLGDRPMASVDYSPPSSARAEKARLGKNESKEEMGEESTRVGDLPELANELRGQEIEVHLKKGTKLIGKVVEVSTKSVSSQRDQEEKLKETATLMLSGAMGLAAISFDDIQFIKPLNAARQRALERLAAAEGAATFQQNLKVRAGKGAALLQLGYLTEAPVWSISYRLSLRGDKARLQAFAQVHNDSDESWENVELTFATGEPTSVVRPIAGPRYARRKIEENSDNLDEVPQLVTQEARSLLNGEKVDVTRRDIVIQSGGSGFGARRFGKGGGGTGIGAVGSMQGVPGRSMIEYQSSSDLLTSPWAPLPALEPETEGDYTLYRARERVSLKAHSSALVPILDVEIPAQRVVVAAPLRTAVRFVNDTRFPFEPGPMSVFDGNSFLGETSIAKAWPKGIYVLKVAPALDIEATVSTKDEYGPIEYIRQEGALNFSLHRMNTKILQVSLTSHSRMNRVVLLPLPTGYRLREANIEEDARSTGQPRFAKLLLKKGEKLELTLHDVASFKAHMNVGSLSRAWLKSETFAPRAEAAKEALARYIDVHAALAERLKKAQQLEQENAQSLAAVKSQLDLLSKAGAKTQVDQLAAKMLALEEEKLSLQKKTAAILAEKEKAEALSLPPAS